MLGVLEKVTLTPTEVTAADMEPLLQLGITEKAIEDALLVCAGFNVIARLADAFDVHVPTPQEFAMAGGMLLKYGYA